MAGVSSSWTSRSWTRCSSRCGLKGDVWSVPEGTVVFPGETLLRVTAPLAQAQWVETHLAGLAGLSDPGRVQGRANGARGRRTIALRVWCMPRARPTGWHAGGPGGLYRRFCGYEPGRGRSSAGDPGKRDDGPLLGPVVRHRARRVRGIRARISREHQPSGRHLLYAAGVRHAAAIEPPVRAIRIDSGDLIALTKEARAILDQLGRSAVKIMVSGDLDEFKIARLVAANAPVDGFGVGTELITSRDAPALSMVYKLVELDGKGKFKLSPGKRTYPMAKQVFRRRDSNGRFAGDHVTRAEETAVGEPLLVEVVRSGRLVRELPRLDAIVDHCRNQLAALPERLRPLDAAPDYPITYSEALEAEARRLMKV